MKLPAGAVSAGLSIEDRLGMAFFLFVLVNAALFIRPAEIIPAMLGWEIYFYVILACLAVSIPEVLKYLTGNAPESQPITLCILGLALVIPIPFLLSGDLGEAWRTGFHFAKVIVYYVLFVSIIVTPARMRILLGCILAFSGIVTLLAVLQYHGAIQLNTIDALKDTVAGQYGDTITIRRLQGTGIFQDPNELCVLLSALVPLCLYFMLSDPNPFMKLLGLALLPLFGYAVYLTQSRGGFIAFAGGLGVLAWMRFGWQKAAMLGAIGLPVLLILFGGRQTEISTSTGTAQTRVSLWRDWMTVFRENAIFGKGMSLMKEDQMKNRRSDEEKRHLAHNSYLQGFADMGIFGGCLLVGAYFTALWSIYRYNARASVLVNADLRTLQPYVMATVSAFALGMLSLSICYIVPTYMMLALSVAFTQMARRSALVAPPPLRLDVPLMARMASAGIGVLGVIYVFVRFLA